MFTVAGALGLVATALAWNSGQYRRLSAAYLKGQAGRAADFSEGSGFAHAAHRAAEQGGGSAEPG